MDVSVIVTSYNQRALLEEAIDSVLEQTVKPDEVIVVDAGSDDGSQDLIEEYAESETVPVRPLLLAKDPGIPRMRNRALETVTGDYVAILDGDDRFLPEKIERETDVLRENPNCRSVYSNVYITDQSGIRIGRRYQDRQSSGRVFPEVFRGQFGMMRSMLIDYDTFESLGFLDPEFSHYDGFEFTVKLAREHEIFYIHEPLAEYRRHPGGAAEWRQKSDELMELRSIYDKHEAALLELPDRQQRELERYWQALLADFEANAALGAGNYASAMRWYLHGLKHDRRVVFNYKKCLNSVLPQSAYNSLQKLYWRLQGETL